MLAERGEWKHSHGLVAGDGWWLLRVTESFTWKTFAPGLIGARKVNVAGTVSLWFLVRQVKVLRKFIYNLLLKCFLKWEQNLISSTAPVPITGFGLNWIGKRKQSQNVFCEGGGSGKQLHNANIWQWGQVCSGGDKLKCFKPIYPETIC